MNTYHAVKNLIEQALKNLGITGVDFNVEHPADISHGDYATNVAMVCAKQLGKSPREVAEMVVGELEKNGADLTVSIAGPGFINIILSKESFSDLHNRITTEPETFGNKDIYTGKTILVEHSSPNLFKPFHIGHLMNNTIGESMTRIMHASGASVFTMTFPSDISLGIAKAIFILLEKYPDGNVFNPSIEILGNAYVTGTQRYESDEFIHDRVKQIADNLFGNIPSPELDLYNTCKEININYFKSIMDKLDSRFDSFVYESQAGVTGTEIVKKYTPSVFTESQGAIVYIPDEIKKHLNTAVFINSQGNPTYEAKDIGLLSIKFEKYNPDVSLFVTDHEQIQHFQIVLDVAEHINKKWSDNSHHIAHGRMTFNGQKMSSRLGGVPLATEIIDTVADEVRTRAGERSIDETTVQSVALSAIKFSILRAKPGSNINFDPEVSLSFEGDSGPYLQYTHARICSLLEKGRTNNLTPIYDTTAGIETLERVMLQYEYVVEQAITEYAPQYIVTYLLELSRAFNSFYGSHQFIDTENVAVSQHRLALADSVRIILKNGLELLAINAPEQM